MELLCLLLVPLLLWMGSARGDLRCYCNKAECISTAYMCESPSGTCYSMIPYDGHSSTSIHGCAESLPAADRAICRPDGELRPQSEPQDWPILICCSDDMCNYSDSLDIKIYVNSKSTTGNSIKGETPNYRGSSHRETGDHHKQHNKVSENYSHRVLWFKAAVIAVPIAGGFILVLLVLLAVRMLRNDSRRHRQLLQMRRHRSLTKAQLYVADHFYPEKCEKQGHWNAIDRHNALYKDVNVKVDYNSHGYKKMTNSSQHSGSCSSIIVWDSLPPPPPTLFVSEPPDGDTNLSMMDDVVQRLHSVSTASPQRLGSVSALK